MWQKPFIVMCIENHNLPRKTATNYFRDTMTKLIFNLFGRVAAVLQSRNDVFNVYSNIWIPIRCLWFVVFNSFLLLCSVIYYKLNEILSGKRIASHQSVFIVLQNKCILYKVPRCTPSQSKFL